MAIHICPSLPSYLPPFMSYHSPFIVSSVATVAFLLFWEHARHFPSSESSTSHALCTPPDFCMARPLPPLELYQFIFLCDLSWWWYFNCKFLPQHSVSPFLPYFSPSCLSFTNRPYLLGLWSASPHNREEFCLFCSAPCSYHLSECPACGWCFKNTCWIKKKRTMKRHR